MTTATARHHRRITNVQALANDPRGNANQTAAAKAVLAGLLAKPDLDDVDTWSEAAGALINYFTRAGLPFSAGEVAREIRLARPDFRFRVAWDPDRRGRRRIPHEPTRGPTLCYRIPASLRPSRYRNPAPIRARPLPDSGIIRAWRVWICGKKDALAGGLSLNPSERKTDPVKEGPTLSKRTQPRDPRLYSITAASIGSRLTGVTGRGREHAPLVWLAILAHTPWDGAKRPTWASNETLANETGLPVPATAYAIARLRDAGMLATPTGRRPGALRRRGRLLVPAIDDPVRVIMPAPMAMAALWRAGFALRKRPAALVTLMVGLHIIAAHEIGRRPRDWAAVPGSRASIRRFVGATRGSTFAARFVALEQGGLIRQTNGLEIAPPCEWRPQVTGDPRWAAADSAWP